MAIMAQVLAPRRRSLAASAPLTDEEIRERHLKHIAEISKHLDTEPIQSEELTYKQQQWMRRKLRSGFTKPVRDQLTELEKRGFNRGHNTVVPLKTKRRTRK